MGITINLYVVFHLLLALLYFIINTKALQIEYTRQQTDSREIALHQTDDFKLTCVSFYILGQSLFVWRLHVLLSVSVFSKHSSFLPQIKNKLIRLIGDSGLLMSVWVNSLCVTCAGCITAWSSFNSRFLLCKSKPFHISAEITECLLGPVFNQPLSEPVRQHACSVFICSSRSWNLSHVT